MSDTVHVSGSVRKILLPLALAQFICSFAGSNMNVMITDISPRPRRPRLGQLDP